MVHRLQPLKELMNCNLNIFELLTLMILALKRDHVFMTAENYSAKHELQKNDILFARTGATVGKTYFYDGSIERQYSQAIVFDFDLMKIK